VDAIVDHFRERLIAAVPDVVHPIRPAWLVPVVAVLVEGSDGAGGGRWLSRVYQAVEQLDGRVPFVVVHDWYANVVVPMWGCEPTVETLHQRALNGAAISQDEWVAALEPALRTVYHRAYPIAEAYSTASANALEYARANGFGEAEAVEYADFYARLSSGANARAAAEAQAIALARALASAFIRADEGAFAATFPFATIRATVESTMGDRSLGEHRRIAYGRLADGLADALGRA
jgi:hypothetical protein